MQWRLCMLEGGFFVQGTFTLLLILSFVRQKDFFANADLIRPAKTDAHAALGGCRHHPLLDFLRYCLVVLPSALRPNLLGFNVRSFLLLLGFGLVILFVIFSAVYL
uniref:Uncharacterized protein n=1 Tax=Oryza nivara TaxID=4536 RepID=A0A0E0IAB2_ORYNI